VVGAVLAVAAGHAFYGVAIAARLTPREREVLELLATGARNSQIATTLGMTDKTVRPPWTTT
jgi:DNA-binding NarL/FixJ family response regulator